MVSRNSISQAILFFPFLLMAQSSNELTIDKFLDQKAIKRDSLEVISNRSEFLNLKGEKDVSVWFNGSLTTTKDIEFVDLKINYNVFDNSLYVLYENEVYKVSNFEISGFSIEQEGKLLKFRKGFAVPSVADIKAIFNTSTQNILSYISTFQGFKELQIREINLTENQSTDLVIELQTGSRNEVYDLKQFLDANEFVKSVEVRYNPSELNTNKYFQVLFEDEKFTVLKYHFKRNTTLESVSLVKHESSFMFDDEDYYIADSVNLLQEFLFTRKSIHKTLTSIGVSYTKKIKNVSNEVKAIRWFEDNTFY